MQLEDMSFDWLAQPGMIDRPHLQHVLELPKPFLNIAEFLVDRHHFDHAQSLFRLLQLYRSPSFLDHFVFSGPFGVLDNTGSFLWRMSHESVAVPMDRVAVVRLGCGTNLLGLFQLPRRDTLPAVSRAPVVSVPSISAAWLPLDSRRSSESTMITRIPSTPEGTSSETHGGIHQLRCPRLRQFEGVDRGLGFEFVICVQGWAAHHDLQQRRHQRYERIHPAREPGRQSISRESRIRSRPTRAADCTCSGSTPMHLLRRRPTPGTPSPATASTGRAMKTSTCRYSRTPSSSIHDFPVNTQFRAEDEQPLQPDKPGQPGVHTALQRLLRIWFGVIRNRQP